MQSGERGSSSMSVNLSSYSRKVSPIRSLTPRQKVSSSENWISSNSSYTNSSHHSSPSQSSPSPPSLHSPFTIANQASNSSMPNSLSNSVGSNPTAPHTTTNVNRGTNIVINSGPDQGQTRQRQGKGYLYLESEENAVVLFAWAHPEVGPPTGTLLWRCAVYLDLWWTYFEFEVNGNVQWGRRSSSALAAHWNNHHSDLDIFALPLQHQKWFNTITNHPDIVSLRNTASGTNNLDILKPIILFHEAQLYGRLDSNELAEFPDMVQSATILSTFDVIQNVVKTQGLEPPLAAKAQREAAKMQEQRILHELPSGPMASSSNYMQRVNAQKQSNTSNNANDFSTQSPSSHQHSSASNSQSTPNEQESVQRNAHNWENNNTTNNSSNYSSRQSATDKRSAINQTRSSASSASPSALSSSNEDGQINAATLSNRSNSSHKEKGINQPSKTTSIDHNNSINVDHSPHHVNKIDHTTNPTNSNPSSTASIDDFNQQFQTLIQLVNGMPNDDSQVASKIKNILVNSKKRAVDSTANDVFTRLHVPALKRTIIEHLNMLNTTANIPANNQNLVVTPNVNNVINPLPYSPSPMSINNLCSSRMVPSINDEEVKRLLNNPKFVDIAHMMGSIFDSLPLDRQRLHLLYCMLQVPSDAEFASFCSMYDRVSRFIN